MSALHGLILTAAGLGLFGLGYALRVWLSRKALHLAENNIEALLGNAQREAEAIIREGKLQARDEVHQAREQFDVDTRARRQELKDLEDRLIQREAGIDRKLESLDRRLEDLDAQKALLAAEQRELDDLRAQHIQRLQEVTGLDRTTAETRLLQELERDLKAESATLVRRMQQDAHETAERDARKIIALAVERYASEQVNEMTTCAVSLPGEEMKGRIIGKEGRNIRAIEAATGVNILIDDTPETVVISGFDPLRREIARQSLEQLIADGRIHPARIEEVVHKVQSEIAGIIRTSGANALFELGLHGIEPAVEEMIGRLKFRHSYGQNVLKHSVEMGHLMGMMASELGLDAAIARRVGLLHDIGKAMDHAIEGSHALIGADFLKKHGETALVVNAVAAHHNEVEAESIYAILARAGDAMTASRPGARSENTEIYLKRLEKLEQIAGSFRGVSRCYAIQAGREVRVFVEPKSIDDHEALLLARNISRQIEHDMQYPGQIKVTVVRETRCVEYAK
ncbi:MAG TPA: ribonuclease Y [Kiritimatiellia bacterium]|nr:ribonuclease Y [Kiritimatiellia bacterium]HMP35320.1 ribonuclease Y [Kiritimatiellia bacterium]